MSLKIISSKSPVQQCLQRTQSLVDECHSLMGQEKFLKPVIRVSSVYNIEPASKLLFML